jgi:hypothetical protein
MREKKTEFFEGNETEILRLKIIVYEIFNQTKALIFVMKAGTGQSEFGVQLLQIDPRIRQWGAGGVYFVKVKFSLPFFLTEHHAMKAYWGS